MCVVKCTQTHKHIGRTCSVCVWLNVHKHTNTGIILYWKDLYYCQYIFIMFYLDVILHDLSGTTVHSVPN